MRSFDPDEVDVEVSEVQLPTRQLREESEATVTAALTLLDEVTSDLPDGEHRDGQRQMTSLVARAIAQREPVAVEAGTGVGKSLAYLCAAAVSGERVVVATATKNLQDQLATKDAPLVRARRPGLRVSVVKGRQNYLCLHRAEEVRGEGQLALVTGDDAPKGVVDQVRRILTWAETTTSGDRDELSFEVDARAWRQVSVTPQECLSKSKCPQGSRCFSERARETASESDVVIVNTHLYASHLASGAMLLPAHDVVILDEAHEAPDIFSTLLGTSLSASRVHAGVSVARSLLGSSAATTCDELDVAATLLSSRLDEQYQSNELRGLSDEVSEALSRVTRGATALLEALRALPDSTDFARRQRATGPLVHLVGDLERLSKEREGELRYLTRPASDVEIELSLVDVGPRLKDDLWSELTGVLSSATIDDTLPERLGLACEVTRVPSPFDYARNALLYVPSDIPARNDPGAEAAIIDELQALIEAAGGRTLALFTNRQVMARVAEVLGTRLTTEVLVQGTLSRGRLIERFRDDPEASLFAVTSFWQGVDVPGHSLSLVTIDRLPFRVPGDPLAEARRERSARPFYEVDLPRATMLLAQGVGRLIRTKDDRGVVCVLDSRLATASYRQAVLRRLPPMRRTRDRGEATAFLGEIRRAHEPRGNV